MGVAGALTDASSLKRKLVRLLSRRWLLDIKIPPPAAGKLRQVVVALICSVLLFHPTD